MHFLMFLIALYFVPAIIAGARQTDNATAILLINLFLGWTFIGWMAALVMAISSAPQSVYYHRRGW